MSGRTPEEGRYSKVSRRMWDDERFRRLSAAPPNAQTLWQRLLTGPELGCIPGLYTARLGGLADALGWSTEDVREKWLEIEQEGMAVADWRAGLVWVPNSIVHNAPNSVNTILGWRLALRELPECELKRRAIDSLREQCADLGEAWLTAFESAMGEPKSAVSKSAKPSRRPRKTPSAGPSGSPHETATAMPSGTPSAGPSDTQEQDSGAGFRKQEQEISEAPPPPPSPPHKLPMYKLWEPTAETLAGIEIAGVARWALPELVGRFKAHFLADPGNMSDSVSWNQRCAKWVLKDWRNPATRPEKPEPSTTGDLGDYGKAADWA